MAQSLNNTPVLWINKYLQSKIATAVFLGDDDTPLGVPLFPTNPTTLDALQTQFIIVPDPENPDETIQAETSGIFGVWDRMFRRRRGPFPHIKCEQVLYYFYATEEGNTGKMVRLQEEIFRLLDREDESAEELNAWAKGREIDVDGDIVSPNFYFHNFKVYQLEEARDIVDFGTARTYAGNKIIIDYDYHYTVDPNSRDF